MFSQTSNEIADTKQLRRVEEESAPDLLKSAVLKALRPKLHCGTCEKPTSVLLNVGNVALVCMECYDRFESSVDFYPGDVLHLEDALEEARRTR